MDMDTHTSHNLTDLRRYTDMEAIMHHFNETEHSTPKADLVKCVYPGFFDARPSPLPCAHIDLRTVINSVVSKMDIPTGIERFFQSLCKATATLEILLDGFWWIYLDTYGRKLSSELAVRQPREKLIILLTEVFHALSFGSDSVGSDGLQTLLSALNVPLTKHEVQESLHQVDEDGNAAMDLQDFLEVFTSRTITSLNRNEIGHEQQAIFSRIAHNACRIFMRLSLHSRDRLMLVYCEMISLCICKVFSECFKKTQTAKAEFGKNFQDNAKRTVYQWFTGVEVTSPSSMSQLFSRVPVSPKHRENGRRYYKNDNTQDGGMEEDYTVTLSTTGSNVKLSIPLHFAPKDSKPAKRSVTLSSADAISVDTYTHSMSHSSASDPPETNVSGSAVHLVRQKRKQNIAQVSTSLLDLQTAKELIKEDMDSSSVSNTEQSPSTSIPSPNATTVTSSDNEHTVTDSHQTVAAMGHREKRRGSDLQVSSLARRFQHMNRESRDKLKQVKKQLRRSNDFTVEEAAQGGKQPNHPMYIYKSKERQWFETGKRVALQNTTPRMVKWSITSYSPCVQQYMKDCNAKQGLPSSSNFDDVEITILDPTDDSDVKSYRDLAKKVEATTRVHKCAWGSDNIHIEREFQQFEVQQQKANKNLDDLAAKELKEKEQARASHLNGITIQFNEVQNEAQEAAKEPSWDESANIDRYEKALQHIEQLLHEKWLTADMREQLFDYTCKFYPRVRCLKRNEEWKDRSPIIGDIGDFALQEHEQFKAYMKQESMRKGSKNGRDVLHLHERDTPKKKKGHNYQETRKPKIKLKSTEVGTKRAGGGGGVGTSNRCATTRRKHQSGINCSSSATLHIPCTAVGASTTSSSGGGAPYSPKATVDMKWSFPTSSLYNQHNSRSPHKPKRLDMNS